MFKRTPLPLVLACLAIAALLRAGTSHPADAQGQTAQAYATNASAIEVHPSSVLGAIHQEVLGVNNNNSDNSAAQLFEMAAPYSAMGIKAGRYPGTSSRFDWRDPKPHTMAYFCNSTTRPIERDGDFDAYMRNVAIPDGISPEITTDFDTSGWPACDKPGDPELAAAWVRYANVEKKYGIKWWEVGNEEFIPGPGDKHTRENGFPTGPNNRYTYALQERRFFDDMKAVDPSIKIGIPITGPASYYALWDAWVMSHAAFDYVAYHYYPIRYPHATDANALAAPVDGLKEFNSPSVKERVSAIRSALVQAGKCKTPCADFPISVSEWSTVAYKPGPQTFSIVQALFAAQVLGEFFDAGIARAEFWNSNGCEEDGLAGQPDTYGWQGMGTAGLLSYSIPDKYLCPSAHFKLPFGTILPSGRAFQIFAESGFSADGGSSVRVDDPYPGVRAYACSNATSFVVVLINLDQNSSTPVSLKIDGIARGSAIRKIQYSKAIYDRSKNGGPFDPPAKSTLGAWSNEVSETLPPWSITSLTFPK